MQQHFLPFFLFRFEFRGKLSILSRLPLSSLSLPSSLALAAAIAFRHSFARSFVKLKCILRKSKLDFNDIITENCNCVFGFHIRQSRNVEQCYSEQFALTSIPSATRNRWLLPHLSIKYYVLVTAAETVPSFTNFKCNWHLIRTRAMISNFVPPTPINIMLISCPTKLEFTHWVICYVSLNKGTSFGISWPCTAKWLVKVALSDDLIIRQSSLRLPISVRYVFRHTNKKNKKIISGNWMTRQMISRRPISGADMIRQSISDLTLCRGLQLATRGPFVGN